jgi:hypothetical protein
MDGWTRGRGLSVLRPIGSLRSACKKHMLSHVEGERNISRDSSGMVSRGMLTCNVTGSKCDGQHKPCMTSGESFDIATTLNESVKESHFSG